MFPSGRNGRTKFVTRVLTWHMRNVAGQKQQLTEMDVGMKDKRKLNVVQAIAKIEIGIICDKCVKGSWVWMYINGFEIPSSSFCELS